MAFTESFGVIFSDDKNVLLNCLEKLKGHYVIPNSVTEIGSEAFQECKNLTSIIIPKRNY